MTTLNSAQLQADQFKDFWNRMAEHYPLPFDEKVLADTDRVIALARKRGVKIAGRTVLDIGCGTGIYALPLARKAAAVTGLDDSRQMITRFKGEIDNVGLRNVQVVKASWKDIDIDAQGFSKAFDVVWTSMTPAVQTLEDFNKMERCARQWCVYIGWGRKRENELMEEVFARHRLRFGPPPGAMAAYDRIAQVGRDPSIDFFETSWEWHGPVEEALEDMVCFIEMQGVPAQRDKIEAVLARTAREGLISHATRVEEGIIVWRIG